MACGNPPPNFPTPPNQNQPGVPNVIDGRALPSQTDRWIELRNPATQELLGRVPQSTPEEVCPSSLWFHDGISAVD